MIGENECAQITPDLLFWKPNRSLGVILSVTWGIAIWEAEQKFGGSRKAERKAMIGENESTQITPKRLFWKPNRSLGVILSVTCADIKDEKQRSRKGRQGFGRMKATK